MLSYFYLPLFLIFLFLLNEIGEKDHQTRVSYVVMVLGLFIVGAIFKAYFEVKKDFDSYAKTAIPALIVFCWLFLWLPFSGIIPSSLFYLSKDDEELVTYERMVWGLTALLLMCGVALIGILIHLFFRRADYERRFKYVASKAIKKLADNGVKSDYHSLDVVYQAYVQRGEEGLKDILVNQSKPIYWIKISKYNSDVRFSKIIVDSEAYEKYTKKEKYTPSKWRKCFVIFMKIFCCYDICCKDDKDKGDGDDDMVDHGEGEYNDDD